MILFMTYSLSLRQTVVPCQSGFVCDACQSKQHQLTFKLSKSSRLTPPVSIKVEHGLLSIEPGSVLLHRVAQRILHC